MDINEWKRIGGMLFAAFPNASVTPETIVVYFEDLREFDARDVAGACTWLRRNTGPFLPSIEAIRAQVEVEREVRTTYEALPEVTGIGLLPRERQLALLEQGVRASVGQREDGDETHM